MASFNLNRRSIKSNNPIISALGLILIVVIFVLGIAAFFAGPIVLTIAVLAVIAGNVSFWPILVIIVGAFWVIGDIATVARRSHS